MTTRLPPSVLDAPPPAVHLSQCIDLVAEFLDASVLGRPLVRLLRRPHCRMLTKTY